MTGAEVVEMSLLEALEKADLYGGAAGKGVPSASRTLAATVRRLLAERDGAVLALKNLAFWAREAQDEVPGALGYSDLALAAEEAVVAVEKGWKNDHQYRPYDQEDTPLTEKEQTWRDTVLREREHKFLGAITGTGTHKLTIELESGVNYFVCKHHPIEHMQRQPCDQCGGGLMARPAQE